MSGIFRIDKKAGTTTFHQQGKSQARETPDKYIRGLIKDKNEVIWSGGFYSLKNFDTRTQEKQEYSSSYPITYLLERNENSFWVELYKDYMYSINRNSNCILTWKKKTLAVSMQSTILPI